MKKILVILKEVAIGLCVTAVAVASAVGLVKYKKMNKAELSSINHYNMDKVELSSSISGDGVYYTNSNICTSFIGSDKNKNIVECGIYRKNEDIQGQVNLGYEAMKKAEKLYGICFIPTGYLFGNGDRDIELIKDKVYMCYQGEDLKFYLKKYENLDLYQLQCRAYLKNAEIVDAMFKLEGWSDK